MGISSYLEKLTSNENILWLVRRFHLQAISKQIYFILMAPLGRQKAIHYKDHRAEFQVKNYEDLLFVNNFFEKHIDEGPFLDLLLKALGPGDTFYDVGANFGIYSIFAGKKIGMKGKVFAFEPEKNSYAKLIRNAAINNLSNIVPFNLALGDRFGEGALFLNERMGLGVSSLIEMADYKFHQMTRVVPGDFWVKEKELPVPKVVKVDVEGYEFAVLKGLQRTLSEKDCLFLLCELHSVLYPQGTRWEEVIRFIKDLGFIYINRIPRVSDLHLICSKGKNNLLWKSGL